MQGGGLIFYGLLYNLWYFRYGSKPQGRDAEKYGTVIYRLNCSRKAFLRELAICSSCPLERMTEPPFPLMYRFT